MPLLADFTARVRRPRPLAGGLLAELFAANGRDADEVMRLGRSLHQDATVDVDIRDEDGAELGGFVASLRRPAPLQSGMVASFFGENGEPADAITALSLSKYLDATVRVQVRLMKLPDGSAPAKAEPKGAFGAPAAVLWKSGFLGHEAVWRACGTDADFLIWLRRQKCCVPPEFGVCAGDVAAMHVRRVANGAGAGIKPEYSAVPGCDRHHGLQHAQGESACGGAALLDRQRMTHLRRWAWECLRELASVESMSAAAPQMIRAWADAAGVSQLLPEGYR